jgi:hypothetical protein
MKEVNSRLCMSHQCEVPTHMRSNDTFLRSFVQGTFGRSFLALHFEKMGEFLNHQRGTAFSPCDASHANRSLLVSQGTEKLS